MNTEYIVLSEEKNTTTTSVMTDKATRSRVAWLTKPDGIGFHPLPITHSLILEKHNKEKLVLNMGEAKMKEIYRILKFHFEGIDAIA